VFANPLCAQNLLSFFLLFYLKIEEEVLVEAFPSFVYPCIVTKAYHAIDALVAPAVVSGGGHDQPQFGPIPEQRSKLLV
jgi:hypothetical protein